MQYTIAVVDDHILIGKAISTIINEHSNYKVLYEVSNGKQLQDKFTNAKNIPDVILLDISMPVMDGFETALWLKRNHPEVLILTLSMQDDDQSIIRMIKNGAKGYLLKNVEPRELIYAIDKLLEHGLYYPEWAASRVFLSLGSDTEMTNAGQIKFTERGVEFFKYVCTELSYREIGEQMFVSVRTVEGYRDSLFSKLNIKSLVGLAVYALKNGYFNP